MTHYVYQLFRQRETLPFYIGMTTNPTRRQQTHRSSWADPTIYLKVVETHRNRETAARREYELIVDTRNKGVEIFNTRMPDRYGGITIKAHKEAVKATRDAALAAERKAAGDFVSSPQFKAFAAEWLAANT